MGERNEEEEEAAEGVAVMAVCVPAYKHICLRRLDLGEYLMGSRLTPMH